MCNNIDVKNSSQILSIADLHDLGDLKKKTIDFIKANLKKVKATKDWKALVKTNKALTKELN